MKAKLLFLLALLASAFHGYSQGTSKFEIWGLTGKTKAAFIEHYKQVTSQDLSYTYTCAADLEKLGYHDSQSLLWVDDIDKFKSGKLNWDSTERLAIIHPMPNNQFNIERADASNQKALNASISKLKDKDTVFVQQYLAHDKEVLHRLLVGLNSKNRSFREDCKRIVLTAPIPSLGETPDNVKLVGTLFTIPDIETCYVAMRIVKESQWSESANKLLFAPGAATLHDFLSSNLQTFSADAVSFLAGRIKSNKSDEKDYLFWSSWLAFQKQPQ